MGRKLIISIEFDSDVESPCEEDGWKLYSFNRRHGSFKHPDHFFHGQMKPKLALVNKLRVGLAFHLGYYEHGQCHWAFSGEQQQCPWDSNNQAGLLIWESKPSYLGAKTSCDRAGDARAFLETYTAWCNGECYYYSIQTENGGDGVSCGGHIGSDNLFESIAEEVRSGDTWTFEGDAADLVTYYEHVLEKATAAAFA